MSSYSPPVSDDLLATVARKYARGHEHAADLLQEARIKVWQTEQAHPGQNPYYYVKAAENRMRDLVVTRYPYFGAPPRDALSVATVLAYADDEGDVPDAEDDAPEPSRAITDAELMRDFPHFYLYQIYGLPIREIAATMNETFKVARNRLESERITFAIDHGRIR
jgi:DNA-directed RNA polymerase specialized sigma24 family protein